MDMLWQDKYFTFIFICVYCYLCVSSYSVRGVLTTLSPILYYWLKFMRVSYAYLFRYQSRRSRSRSNSRSPVRGRYRDHARGRSPRRSVSPEDRRPPISDRLKSRLGARDDKQSPDRVKSKSKSRSNGSSCSRSRSPDATPPKRYDKRASVSRSRSRSSSASGQKGLVSYGDASPDSGAR